MDSRVRVARDGCIAARVPGRSTTPTTTTTRKENLPGSRCSRPSQRSIRFTILSFPPPLLHSFQFLFYWCFCLLISMVTSFSLPYPVAQRLCPSPPPLLQRPPSSSTLFFSLSTQYELTSYDHCLPCPFTSLAHKRGTEDSVRQTLERLYLASQRGYFKPAVPSSPPHP